MSGRKSISFAVLSICAAGLIPSLAGCNAHPIKSVQYDTEAVCGETVNIPVTKPELVLVVDRSGSMSDNPLGDETRWQALHGVISQVVDGQDANTQFGLAMFPAEDAGDQWPGACSAPSALDVAVGGSTGTAIMSALPAADAMTSGGTPAAAAIELAADHLRGTGTEEPKLMVLVTDGAANCAADSSDALDSLSYDEGLQDAVASAEIDGITTYVVGIQISTELDPSSGVVPAEMLDEVAVLGGAPLEGDRSFYSVEDQAALAAALDSITADIGCTMELGSAVDPTREAAVSVDGAYVSEVAECEAEDGWMFGGEDGTSLVLCGQACADFQASGEVEFEYLCS